MKILIIGASGQVGSALADMLSNYNLVNVDRKNCDLRNLDNIRNIIDKNTPDLIINSAAYTKVDLAEDEKDVAFKINCDAPKAMAEKAFEHEVPFIHFSTDYVYDGEKKDSYLESDVTNPLNAYGQSKLEGDRAIQEIGGQFYIFRTSWIYSNKGKNFYLTVKRLLEEHKELHVVYDQFGVPTSNYFVARVIKNIINQLNKNNIGIYNLVPNGSCSWFDFAKLIISKVNPEFNFIDLNKIPYSEYPSSVVRPKNSVLNNNKIKSTFMLEFEGWESELDQIINES